MRAGAIFLASFLAVSAFASEQRFAALGDFTLDSGHAIRDCRIGYRLDGAPDEARSNVIIVTTWFAGRSADLGGWIGPGKLFDTNRWYVVSIDAFGNGVSSSPSNSTLQPGAAFPKFTIRDLVRSQHQLLTKHLGFEHVYAVAGLSMGGMQTFQWTVSYPSFMEKAISIVGTPRQTSSDILLWQTELDLLEGFSDSPQSLRKAMRTVAAIQAMEIRTPAWLARSIKPVDALQHLETHRKSLESRDPWDYMAQLRGMLAHDIGRNEEVAGTIRARMLIVVALQDEMVNPGPARELATLLRASLVTLSGDCGHLASGCEREVLEREVTGFLAR